MISAIVYYHETCYWLRAKLLSAIIVNKQSRIANFAPMDNSKIRIETDTRISDKQPNSITGTIHSK